MQTKALRIYGKEDLRLETFELPELKDNEILAKIVSDSLCMSSYKAAEQGADHGDQQQENNYGNEGQQDQSYVFHSSTPRFFLKKKYATPMAIAPLGRIIKLVEPTREGTKINRTLSTIKGSAAIFKLPR